MKLVKKIIRIVLFFLAIPFIYILIALLMSYISVNHNQSNAAKTHTVYLHTNGVHLDVALKKTEMDSLLLKDIYFLDDEDYISFGWGDENFYLNTPTWGDLTLKTAFKALFTGSSSLLHLTLYKTVQPDWISIKVSEEQYKTLSAYIQQTFVQNANGQKERLPMAYGNNDNFYRAHGSYTCFNTCNTWVNTRFKQSKLKACLWTPFDFGLLNLY